MVCSVGTDVRLGHCNTVVTWLIVVCNEQSELEPLKRLKYLAVPRYEKPRVKRPWVCLIFGLWIVKFAFLQMAADPVTDFGSDRKEATTKTKGESRCNLLGASCKRFWLSVNPLYQTLALGMVLLVYLCASALVFVWLEADAEEERIAEASRVREELKLMLSVELPNTTSERIDSILDSAACDVQANESVRLWDMGRAVVVAASIVATIGKCAPLHVVFTQYNASRSP